MNNYKSNGNKKMALEISFELDDSDLEYFRDVMVKAREGISSINETEVLAHARKLSGDIKDSVPDFISQRLHKLETLADMVEDDEWQLPEKEKSDVLSALAYFSHAEDLIPDHIPALGLLDDAIMIELVVEELKHDIEAFLEFCQYRVREAGRKGDAISKEDWLDSKRRELHSRMRHRRSRRVGRRASFRSIF